MIRRYALLLLLTVFITPIEGQTVDRVVARVNQEIIMASDVAEAVAGNMGVLTEKHGFDEVMKRLTPDTVRVLIDRALIMEAAKENKISASKQDVDRQVEEIVAEVRAGFPSEAAFRNELAKQELTMAEFKQALRKRAEANYKTFALVSRRFILRDEDVAKHEVDERAQGHVPMRLQLRRLAVQIQGSGKAAQAEAEKKANELVTRFTIEGLSFEEGVRKYTAIPQERANGGDLGFMSAEKLAPAVLKATENLEVGEASAPVIAGDYACVFYVEAKRGAKHGLQEKRFSEEKEKLLQELRRKARIEIYDPHMQKLLPKEYKR